MGNELPELTLADAGAWRAWLAENHEDPSGVWLVLAKKGTTAPTRLSYDEANVARVERLTAEGRMHPAGSAEVAQARADGRWPQERATD
jgi:uncharacterized protein YdeI (YjbR/CyaY-like superfamily)